MVEAQIVALNSPSNSSHESKVFGRRRSTRPRVGSESSRTGSKLIADLVNVPNALVGLIRNGNYKNKSAEIYWNYIDPADVEKRNGLACSRRYPSWAQTCPRNKPRRTQRVLMSDNSRHSLIVVKRANYVYTTPIMTEVTWTRSGIRKNRLLGVAVECREGSPGDDGGTCGACGSNLATRDEDSR